MTSGCLVGMLLAVAHPQFEKSAIESLNGAALLEWSGDTTGPYELETSQDAAFDDVRVVYRGREPSAFVSGLLDGEHYYRVRASTEHSVGPWSTPATVSVRHHQASSVWPLFGLGACTFVLTVAFIAGFARREGSASDV